MKEHSSFTTPGTLSGENVEVLSARLTLSKTRSPPVGYSRRTNFRARTSPLPGHNEARDATGTLCGGARHCFNVRYQYATRSCSVSLCSRHEWHAFPPCLDLSSRLRPKRHSGGGRSLSALVFGVLGVFRNGWEALLKARPAHALCDACCCAE